MFGNKGKDFNTENVSQLGNSLPPGIYRKWRMTGISTGKAQKQDGSEGKAIIQFVFQGRYKDAAGNVLTGKYTHTEWETDESKKADNLVKRITHILSKYVSKEVIEANDSNTFEEYQKWIEKTLEGVDYKAVDVDFKLLGQVYNGKRSCGFPGYTGFIFKSDDASALQISDSERSNNAKWHDFEKNPLQYQASGAGAGMPGADLPTGAVDNLPF